MECCIPRIVITAPKSGEGKTTITCGILQALINKGLNPASFKCGPDYIDPLFHSEIIGTKSSNLDLFFTSENTAKYLLDKHSKNCDIAIIEGAMGFYDGIGGKSEVASAYHLAKATKSPVILVIDTKGSALSVCATIKGFMDFREDSNVKGVILNRCSKMQVQLLKQTIEKECGVRVLGSMPQDNEMLLESRHLGLVTAKEVDNIRYKIDVMAKNIEQFIDIDSLIEIAKASPKLQYEPLEINNVTQNKPKIAVAKDKAFCFYYKENLQLLEELGAEIVYFSPLNDEDLPKNINALYFGGGYPELYAEALSQNKAMIDGIKTNVADGMPTFAECGGFMYLLSSMEDKNNKIINLCNIIDGNSHYTGKLGRFGYITITAKADNILCKKGEAICAHEFHYYDSSANGNSFNAKKPMSNRSWECINAKDNIFAGYPHLYFYSNIEFAKNFVKSAEEYKKKL